MAGDWRSHYTKIPVVPTPYFTVHPLISLARKSQSGADLARSLREQGITHILFNVREAMRTSSGYTVFEWDSQSWSVFDDFWNHYVDQVWAEVRTNPEKALIVYRIRSDLEATGNSVPPPPNPFVLWKPNPHL